MNFEWDLVKRTTLWHYEELIPQLLDVLDYPFVRDLYNHTMDQAAAYSELLRHGYRQNGREAVFIREVSADFRILSAQGVRDYEDLVRKIDSRTKCEVFLQATGIPFEALIQMLNYLFRWVLPFRCPVRELLDAGEEPMSAALVQLRLCRVRSNLDVLENCRTGSGRAALASKTGMVESFMLDLAHRADISRLAYVRGKTVNHLCRGGSDTLEKISNADLRQMEADMAAYYATLGKTLADFRAVIPLDWMIGGARVLPRVIEA